MCDAILEVLHPEFIKFPTSEEEWLATSREYEFAWNFTHCVAAIDGKHVIMQAPAIQDCLFIIINIHILLFFLQYAMHITILLWWM